MSDSSSQGTSAVDGKRLSVNVRLPRPAPKVNSLSSAKYGSARSLAALMSARILGAASTAESCLNLANAALSSMTGKNPRGEFRGRTGVALRRRHQRILEDPPSDSGSRSARAAHSAHSLTSVASNN